MKRVYVLLCVLSNVCGVSVLCKAYEVCILYVYLVWSLCDTGV